MKNEKPTGAFRGLRFAGLLTIILAVIFWKSFLPDYVHFSNDGPLGQLAAAQSKPPGTFTGSWGDLNGIGGNAGSASPNINALENWILGSVGYSKFNPPIALFILGLGAWAFFRQLKLSPLAATLGALAAALNAAFFSTACWGVASQQIAVGMSYFALALIVSNTPETPARVRWLRWALAGLAVGADVMQGADIGAIFSVFIAAFVFYKTLVDENGAVIAKVARSVGRIAVIALFAGFLATQTIVSLVGVAIVGVATNPGGNSETKLEHWDWATQWSIPKKETLGFFVPGLFGYRMDTPKDMMAFQDEYKGGEYWGGVGRTPEIDRYFDTGKKDSPPPGMMRFTGGGNYGGVLVSLIAFWAIAQSLRRKNSVFAESQKKLLWFWIVILIVSLLLSWGRFSWFYQLFYMLPYAPTMRNPCKFGGIFSWAFAVIFAYGVHGLSRRYLEVAVTGSNSFSTQLKNWWAKARGFDRNWTLGCLAAVGASLLAWLVYAAEKPDLVKYLQTVGFGDAGTASEIAAFSIGQVGWFVLIFLLSVGLFILVIAGIFSGGRARLGGILIGVLVVADLVRADLPWVIHWDYKQKYEIGSLNPIESFLKDKPYEHRVAGLPFHAPDQFALFSELYGIEWTQHHFLYYNIQCLDDIQNPRPPADIAAFDGAVAFRGTQETIPLIARKWQLTNTRYLLGATVSAIPSGNVDTLSLLNEALDPAQHRFRIVTRFSVVPKPGIAQPTRLEELTAVPNENGDYALFEFIGALPRVKLYSNWQVSTNDAATLQTLADKNFDAQQTVLVSTPLPTASSTGTTNQNSGTVEFKSYAPKDIVFDANATAPSVLLLNDKYDSQWRALVDGKPAPIFRANYIMRGIYLTPGKHTVEFRFYLPNRPLYISLAAIGVGIILLGCLFFSTRPKEVK